MTPPRNPVGLRPATAAAILVLITCGCARQAPSLADLQPLTIDGASRGVREAMEQADHAAHTSPLDAAANGHLGMVLHAHDRYGAAEVAYRRAAILDQRSARWLYYLGVVQAEQAKNADAEASYRQALDRDPGNVPVRLRLAEALWGSGNLPQSAVEYRAILATQPGNALAHHGLGRVLAAQGQWADAVASYRRAIDLYPRFGAAHHAVSQAYQHLGDETSAARHRLLSDVNSSGEPVRDDPWMSAVFALNRSRTYFVKRAAELASAGLLTDAAAAYERSIELEPKDPLVAQVRTRLIGVYTDLGEWNQVEMNYHAALELDPRQADAHFFYGVACVRRGRIDEAAQAFVQALQIDPTHAWAHNQLGRLLEQRGQVAEAERHYRQAIASDPQHRMALFNIGHLLAERREYGAAISYLVRTLTPEDLNTPRYAHYLATIYERAGQRDRAITSARAAKAMAVTFGRGDLVATLDSYLTRLGDMAPAAARGSRVAAPEAVSAGAGDHGAGGRGAIE